MARRQRRIQSIPRLPMIGRKGGMAIAAGAALGGLAGAAMGGMAGALFVNRSARERVQEAVGTAGKYAAAAVETFTEEDGMQRFPQIRRGRKGGRASRATSSRKGR